MQKKKRWQLALIVAVTVLTVYNILPTVFFYTKPLSSPINESKANAISVQIAERINTLEPESIDWIKSFCRLLKVKPTDIKQAEGNERVLSVSFSSAQEASFFRYHLPRSGALISFVPSQLSLYGDTADEGEKTVQVQRNISVHFDPAATNSYFQFATKLDDKGEITPSYRSLVTDRVLQIALTLGGTSRNNQLAEALIASNDASLNMDLSGILADQVVSFTKAFDDESEVTSRFFASFTNPKALAEKIKTSSATLSKELQALQKEESEKKAEGLYLDTASFERKELLTAKIAIFDSAVALLQKAKTSDAVEAWNYATIGSVLQKSFLAKQGDVQTLSLEGRNPFIETIRVDFLNEEITLLPYKEIVERQNNQQVEQFLFNEIAYLTQQTDETIVPTSNGLKIALFSLQGSQSFLALRLSAIAEKESTEISKVLRDSWSPKHPDLQPEVFPIVDYSSYAKMASDQKTLGLVVYAPVSTALNPETGFRMNSVYVIAKGMDKILKKYEADPSSADSQLFIQDFQKLKNILRKSGYMGYEGSLISVGKEFAGDFIFESPDYFQNVLAASRENFSVKGTKRYAILEFSDKEQRILAENKIGDAIHEDLLQWRDDYRAAQLNLKGTNRLDVPKPTKSTLLSNLKLSAVKYFRGDERKILHWGLDLSGGKTVQMELRDVNNRIVTDEIDIKQGINELYSRVNKMGVSEVSIRQEGNLITLDFPGSQNLSGAELVKASSMFFHVVNEKFTANNPLLAGSVNKFLQEVWNEAVVTNRKSSEDINRIACKHLYGEALDPDTIQARSESAKILYSQGLRLALPSDTSASNTYNDTYSKVAVLRGSDFTDWQGQTHPLLIVFRNFALEGSDLENVHASYDPSRGNFLSFGVRSSYTSKEGIKMTPRDEFASWTKPFSKETVAGTPNGQFSRNLGWRMAVVLNGTIVSSPTLDSALKDSAMITGSFSQREINQLEGDLKAGSLSFTPRILSEKNVSPELGSKERTMGIVATLLALVLVIGVMVGYYRFGGMIASIAVLFNILIMWATLQNINATLTLASLAGLILTVGMAVDANVLVFERIREEFAATGRITSAVHAGYKKAFSAILDSNVTTIIAALILLQFDSGPIKGFAVTLIIGILSSMFTALFLTRFIFTRWIQNPKNKSLTMLNWFKAKKFDFLSYGRTAMVVSAAVLLMGVSLFLTERHSLFGMDFTGGYALNVELTPNKDVNYRQSVEKALIQAGAKGQEIQVRELSPSNSLRIFLSKTLELPGRPLSNLPVDKEAPQIEWVISSLQKANVAITESSISQTHQNWSVVSGQMSHAMRNSAIIGLLIALACIFFYIMIRFEFKYAISATLCLIHDLLFTLAGIALVHFLGLPVQIDLTTVAALMTIAGYSLNDTIIVFDRIREEAKGSKRADLSYIINKALNVTLSRTVLTSGTTLIVLIPLILMGGSTIFGFTLVMAIGVIFGTLSSLFIAAPLMLFFHKRELEKEQKIALHQ